MSLKSAISNSWSNAGIYGQDRWDHDISIFAKTKRSLGNTEGFLHRVRREAGEMIGFERGNMINNPIPKVGSTMYGGGIFTRGGWNEIMYKASGKGTSAVLGGARSRGGRVGQFALKGVVPGLIAGQFMYNWNKEGFISAAGTAIQDQLMFSAATHGLRMIGAGALVTAPLAIGAATILGGRAALQAGRKYNRDLRKANLGMEPLDIHGNLVTMRQASIAAIRSSRINGRSALGQEASLMHY